MNSSWFHRFISLDEMKSSSLVISFLVFSGIAVYLLINKGEIPQNLTTLLSIQIGVIGGVNAFNYVSNNMAMSRNNQQIQMPYQNNMNGYGMSPYGMNNTGMMNQPLNTNPSSVNGIQNNNINPVHNLNDPPVQQMPIVQNSGVKSPV